MSTICPRQWLYTAVQDRTGDVEGDATHWFAGEGIHQWTGDFGTIFEAFGNSEKFAGTEKGWRMDG